MNLAEQIQGLIDRTSDRLRKLARKDGRPIKQLAALLEIHPVNFSQFLAGKRELRASTLDRLAEILRTK